MTHAVFRISISLLHSQSEIKHAERRNRTEAERNSPYRAKMIHSEDPLCLSVDSSWRVYQEHKGHKSTENKPQVDDKVGDHDEHGMTVSCFGLTCSF